MVGASGFEPPTSWSRTIGQRPVYHLQAAASITQVFSMLLVFGKRCTLRLALLGTSALLAQFRTESAGLSSPFTTS